LFWSGGGGEFQELVERAHIPFLLMGQGRGVVPEDHPLYVGPFRPSAEGLRQAEVVLLIGARLDWRLSFGECLAPEAKIIQVDIDPSQISHNRPAAVALVGDARAILRQMLQEFPARGPKVRRDPWVAECRAQAQGRAQRLAPDLLSDRVPIHPLRLCREVGEFLGREDTVAVDGGDISVFASWALRSYRPGRWLDNGPLWCLGTGLPFAIAAKLARPQERVLVLNGDGSFGMNAMEFHTALRHHLPIVVVISNDGAWGMMKHAQEEAFGRAMGTELGVVRYDLMVAALGGYGEFVERPQDIRPALERAFASGLPACINVAVDPKASSRRAGESV
ncbi:MAG: thiamine pyrophosphate-dependent enzyme, partial [Chloroflexota bacterium]